MTDNYAAMLRDIEKEIFARRPEHSISPSLDRIRALVTLLGDPQRAYPVIHITGTNGKTSTSRMTEALLRARGLRTGLFTSPHLSSVRERICVDGQPLDAERFVAAYEEIQPYLDVVDAAHEVPLSFFRSWSGWPSRSSPTRRSMSAYSRSAWAAPGTTPTLPTAPSPS